MIKYTLLIPLSPTHTVLIKKLRPSYLKGKLNFIGGKVELGEDPKKAALREFYEETGVRLTPAVENPLTKLATMLGPDYEIYIYMIKVDQAVLETARTATDEEVFICHLGILREAYGGPSTGSMGNRLDNDLPYLLELAILASTGVQVEAIISRQ